MSRPASTPRLRDLQPDAVADEVVQLVVDHVTRLVLAVDLSATWQVQPEACQLRWTTQLLVRYAQRGLAGTDWEDHGCATDALADVCAALYSQAGVPGTFGAGPLEEDADPETAIGVVLLAAHARVRMSRRERVPVRELAALAGVAPDHVRLLARQGELTVEDARVRPADARRWLAARGVEGV